MLKNDYIRLRHILDSAKEATELAYGKSRQSLDTDRTLSLSLIYLLIRIGEASRFISMPFQENHPGIPWKKMIGMRDRLVHGYFDVNLDIVWQTVKEDLPQLIVQIEDLLSDSKLTL